MPILELSQDRAERVAVEHPAELTDVGVVGVVEQADHRGVDVVHRGDGVQREA
jgi:hypothetical protein